jgi:hypothetical protein
LYFDVTSASDCNAKFPGETPMFFSSTCAERANDWSYTDSADLEAKCTSSSDDDDDGADFADLASKCCSDGESVCGGGYCFRGDNTVQSKVTSSALRSTGAGMTKKLTELKVGDLVATADLAASEHHHQMKWTKVVGLPRSKSTADFIKVTMDEGSSTTTTSPPPQVVVVTEHHTFPTCHSKASNKGHHTNHMVAAHTLKAGDCLLTSAGKGTVAKVQHLPAGPNDQTYTVVLEGGRDLLMLGGVVTQAKPQSARSSFEISAALKKNLVGLAASVGSALKSPSDLQAKSFNKMK